MKNNEKYLSLGLSKDEIAAEQQRMKEHEVMQITGRPYTSEAADIEATCRGARVELTDVQSVKKIADEVIKQRNAAGILPSGQPCI